MASNYKKKYLDFFNLTEFDFHECVVTGEEAVDFHHLQFKKSGGSSMNLDEAWNITPLSRKTHDKAHDSRAFNTKLKRMHFERICEYIAARLKLNVTIGIQYHDE